MNLPSNIQDFSEIRINVYTQPKLTSIGKKKPEIFELRLNGKVEEQFELAKSFLDKEIKIEADKNIFTS